MSRTYRKRPKYIQEIISPQLVIRINPYTGVKIEYYRYYKYYPSYLPQNMKCYDGYEIGRSRTKLTRKTISHRLYRHNAKQCLLLEKEIPLFKKYKGY